jgi:hypothetical protein
VRRGRFSAGGVCAYADTTNAAQNVARQNA